MSSRSASILLPLGCSLLVGLTSSLAAQAVPEPAKKDAEAKALPPALRYVDEGRTQRSQKWAALSTAQLAKGLLYRMEWEAAEGDTKAGFRIHIQARVTTNGDLVLSMPAWRPGSYRIANYGKAVQELKAKVGSRNYEVENLETNLWKLTGLSKGDLEVSYKIAGRRSKLRSRNKDEGDCYRIRGPALWMSEVRHKDETIRVELSLPKNWQVTTGLERKGAPKRKGESQIHKFEAPDYDVLIDCPLMIGNYEYFDFRLDGRRFEIALYGASKDKTDRQEFASRIKKICGHFGRMFGGFPFEHYSFLFLTGGFGGGGLEHLNSTNISMSSLRGSRPGRKSWTDSVISHEFFHLWNVKRLRPEALGPFDYTGANRTTALWFSEGFTSYYGDKCLTQVGLQGPKDYWKHMARNYTNLRRNPNRARLDIAETSWTVWDGPYMGRPGTVSYYLKGECLGLLVDILIRDATGNAKSLDDVMRKLYEQCMETGRGFAEDDLRNACSEIAGKSLDDFFDRHVYGTEDLPLDTVLPKAGLEVKISGEGRRTKVELSESEKPSKLALKIRKGLLAPIKKSK